MSTQADTEQLADATPPSRTRPIHGRTLVDNALFTRLVNYLVRETHDTRAHAASVVDQALAFLGTLATHAGGNLSPSNEVDPGWHAFILHSREYTDWCNQHAGRYIHHTPLPSDGTCDGMAVRATVEAIREAGYDIDPALWKSKANCNQPSCDGDDGRPY